MNKSETGQFIGGGGGWEDSTMYLCLQMQSSFLLLLHFDAIPSVTPYLFSQTLYFINNIHFLA